MLVNSVVTIFLFVIVYVMADLIIYLNQEPEVAAQAVSYAKIIAYSIIPFMVFQTFRQFIEGLSFTKPAMYITVGANLINVFGNWIFIFGNLGVRAYGLDGAGYSTLLTRGAMAAAMMVYVMKSIRYKQFEPNLQFRNINWPVIKRLVKLGIPTGFQHFFEVGAFSFSAVMIGWLGSSQLAAHQVALSLAAISFMIILGISSAGTIRVGYAFGRRSSIEVKRSGYLTTIFAGIIMAIFGVCFILFRHRLPFIFINEPEVVGIASSLLIVAAFFQISDGAQAAGLGILRGITDVKIPMIITFIAYWMVALPVGYLLGFTFKMDVVGIWIGLFAGLTVAAVLLNLRFAVKIKNLDFDH